MKLRNERKFLLKIAAQLFVNLLIGNSHSLENSALDSKEKVVDSRFCQRLLGRVELILKCGLMSKEVEWKML